MWRATGILGKLLVRYIRTADHPGKLRIVRQIATSLFEEGIPLTADNEARIEVDPHDFIGWTILNQGAYEPRTLQRAASILENGGTFVDAGANIGLFTVYLGILPNVACVSVEPHPANFLKLRRNLTLNPSVHACCCHLALSNKEETLELEEINPANSGTVRVYSDDAFATRNSFAVAAFPLQSILAYAKLEGVTLLKVDVEGFELNVLKGLDWRGRYRPENVLLEFTDYGARLNGGRKSILRFLSERGYSAYTVEGQPLSDFDHPTEDNAWFR